MSMTPPTEDEASADSALESDLIGDMGRERVSVDMVREGERGESMAFDVYAGQQRGRCERRAEIGAAISGRR